MGAGRRLLTLRTRVRFFMSATGCVWPFLLASTGCFGGLLYLGFPLLLSPAKHLLFFVCLIEGAVLGSIAVLDGYCEYKFLANSSGTRPKSTANLKIPS